MNLYLFAILSCLIYYDVNDTNPPYLTNVIGFECDSTIFSRDSIIPEIAKYTQYEDGCIEVSVIFSENCQQVKNGMLEVHGDTLNLKYDDMKIFKTKVTTADSITTEIEYVFSDYSFCDCLFELTYFIQGIPDKEYIFKLNGKLLKVRID